MRTFTDEDGAVWTATAREENTPRHHGRWYLVFVRGDADRADAEPMPMAEVRWQTRATAARTLQTMSAFELRRRLHILLQRSMREDGASPEVGAALEPESHRARTSVNAG